MSLVKQRIAVFDLLDKLKAEVGNDPKAYVASVAAYSFRQPSKDSGDGSSLSQPAFDSALVGNAAPLLRIFASIDNACDFFHLHPDFVDVSSASSNGSERDYRFAALPFRARAICLSMRSFGPTCC